MVVIYGGALSAVWMCSSAWSVKASVIGRLDLLSSLPPLTFPHFKALYSISFDGVENKILWSAFITFLKINTDGVERPNTIRFQSKYLGIIKFSTN